MEDKIKEAPAYKFTPSEPGPFPNRKTELTAGKLPKLAVFKAIKKQVRLEALREAQKDMHLILDELEASVRHQTISLKDIKEARKAIDNLITQTENAN